VPSFDITHRLTDLLIATRAALADLLAATHTR